MNGLFKFDIKFILILILLAILFFNKCGNDEKYDIVTHDGTKYQLLKHTIDTVEVFKTSYGQKKGDDIFHEVYEIDTTVLIQKVIDTEEVIKDYFRTRVYKDTLKLKDSIGFVFIIDTIHENKLLNRYWIAEVKERTINDNKVLKDIPKTQYYIGLTANLDKTDFLNSVGTGFLIQDTKKNIYQINFGLSNKQPYNSNSQMTPYVGGGIYWKIKK